jgi:hypothetical protein
MRSFTIQLAEAGATSRILDGIQNYVIERRIRELVACAHLESVLLAELVFWALKITSGGKAPPARSSI